MKVLVFTTLFPNGVDENHGIFVRHRIAGMAKLCDIRVVAPVPYFPELKISRRWHRYSQVLPEEEIGGLKVYHPRYFIIPKILRSLYGIFMYLSTAGFIKKLYREFPFDIIDAHFVYPDGMAAVLLGKLMKKKVVITARGTDINVYKGRFFIRLLIKYALKNADSIIAVSDNLKEEMIKLGIPDAKIRVIPNGVDKEALYPSDRGVARRILDLPRHAKIILSVGNLVESKGFHTLIKAARLLTGDNIYTYIIGKGPYEKRLREMADEAGFKDKIIFPGAVPHPELQKWYSAADVFCLLSEREGRPNVVLEALACGTPVVTMRKWGMESIVSPEAGILLDSYEHPAAADAIRRALDNKWDRYTIKRRVDGFDWEKTASAVKSEFDRVLRQRDILLFSSEDWDSGQRTSKHHLALNLSKDHRVVFIESIGLRSPGMGKRDIKKIFKKISRCLSGIKKINENIYVYTPLAVPFHGNPAIKRLNSLILRAQMWAVAKKMRFNDPIYWTFLPSTADMLKKHKDRLVYYCVDDMSYFTGVNNELVKKMDEELTKDARVVFAVSETLYDDKKAINPNTYYMPHGVNYEHFANGDQKAPALISNIARPIIGFFGLISEDWIDLDLLSHIAQSHPEWSIVMIGKLDVDSAKLPSRKNIYYLGQLPFDDLPSYAKLFDVAIIPFNVNGLTRHCNPLKVYEYCAAGKPVVSVDIPELRKLNGMVRIADSNEDFVRHIEGCLKEDTREEALKRIELAKNNSWEQKTEKVWSIVERYF